MSSGSNGKVDEVCRDWMRNVCNFGNRCKFKHPPKEISDVFEKNTVCHDYQNPSGCTRMDCKFLHLTKDEEKHIREHGTMPPSLTPSQRDRLFGMPPMCNDYLRGACSRGSHCKFRHVGPDGEDIRKRAMLDDDMRPSKRWTSSRYDPYLVRDPYDMRKDDRDIRARHYAEEILEDENAYLRAQLDRLRRQVADLTAENDILLDQNAKLRASNRDSVRPVALSTSLTPVVSPGVSDIYSSSRSQGPVSQVHPQPTLSHQLALNSELAQKAALRQRMTREHGSAGGSLAPGPTSNTPYAEHFLDQYN